MSNDLITCNDCGEEFGALNILDREKSLCRECVIKRLRRHEKHSDAMLHFATEVIKAVQNKQPIDAHFIVSHALDQGIQLTFLAGDKAWYHLSRDEICALYAKEEISEGTAADLLDVHIIEFRKIFQESTYAVEYYGYDPKQI